MRHVDILRLFTVVIFNNPKLVLSHVNLFVNSSTQKICRIWLPIFGL